MVRSGTLFVVSAPSGAGKTTLCQEVVKRVPHLIYSVSYTTRKPRSGEVHGRDYYFIDRAQFQQRIEAGDFIEWAEVHGNLYGTSQKILSDFTRQGDDVIMDVDVQGSMTLQSNGSIGVYIYILPPSYESLRERLTRRQSDSPDEVARRLAKASDEVWSYRRYTYVIVNSNFQIAVTQLEAIVQSERLRMSSIDSGWIASVFGPAPIS